jgi:DNA polymerase-1
MNEKKLFLLDAYALIYRAHFAFSRTPRINSKGLNTGVMFGFTNTLLEVLQKQKPSHIAVVFDTSAPTFRHEQYTEYKSNRQETPEDIKIGIPVVKDIVHAFNIPVIEMDGYEADDLIGTLANKACTKGFDVYMMTPDKDFGQLVNECVWLYKPSYMGSTVELLGPEEVKEKWNIEKVDQVVDMLGLQGDASDNIPGIPGVGPKTASKLIKEFGSVENLVANADKLKGKLRENIETFGKQGILSKQLATINIEAPIEFDEEALVYSGPDEKKIRSIFEELEFRAILKRMFGEDGRISARGNREEQLSLFGAKAAAAIEKGSKEVAEEQPKKVMDQIPYQYHLTDEEDKINELVKYLLKQKAFAVGAEATSNDPKEAELVGISFCYYKHETFYIPLDKDGQRLKKLQPVLESENIVKIGSNLKFLYQLLKSNGILLKGKFFDIHLAHYLVEPETRHDIYALAEFMLNYLMTNRSEQFPKGRRAKDLKKMPSAELAEVAGEEVDNIFQLKEPLEAQLKKTSQLELLEKIELPLVTVLADMEYEGVKVDPMTLAEMSEDLDKACKIVQGRVYELAQEEFNIGSPKQLGEILFNKLKLIEKPKKTKSGQYATGEDILVRLAAEHEIAGKILECREYLKLKNTYIDALPKMISKVDGRIHTDYAQTVAATGRLSSVNPNLQNIPIRTEKGKAIRKAFVPRDKDHKLLSADYSQIELRIVASFAKDESMISAFREGRDIHTTTAAKVFNVPMEQVDANMRRKAKEVNFGIIYGISAFGLSQNLNISRSEGSDIIAAYFKEFPSIKEYMDESIEKARQQGFVETLMGRRRYLRDINSRNATMRGYAERNAINAPIQGSAADIIKLAMVNIHNWMQKAKLKSKMILQVHDELIFDVHKEELEEVRVNIIKLMESAVKLEVPMKVDAGIGKNWLEAH